MMKLISILLFIAIPIMAGAQHHRSTGAMAVMIVKHTFSRGIKNTAKKVIQPFHDAKFDLTLAATRYSKVKNRKYGYSRMHKHRKQSELQIAMHFSIR